MAAPTRKYAAVSHIYKRGVSGVDLASMAENDR